MASRKSRPHAAARPRISGAVLLQELRLFIDAHPPLAMLFGQYQKSWTRIVSFVEALERQRELMEALTLLHMRSQMEFERALFCAWGSMLVAAQLNLALQHQRALFYAGLLQDIGKHLPANYANTVLLPAVARQSIGQEIDHHPLLSSVQLESCLPEVEGLSELVLYHHARDDGTGYPAQVCESQLPLDCQILILANEVSDRLDRMGGHNQLPKLLPGLRLGSLLYFEQAHRGWLAFLQPLVSELEVFYSERHAHVTAQRRQNLRTLAETLLALSAELLPLDRSAPVRSARLAIQKLSRILIDSGVVSESIDGELSALPMEVQAEIEMVLRGVCDFLEPCLQSLRKLLDMPRLTLNRASLRDALRLLERNLSELRQPAASVGLFRF